MRIILTLAGGIIALLCLAGAIAFGLYALYQWLVLQPEIVTWLAALLTAVAACLIVLLLAVLVRGCWKSHNAMPHSVRDAESWLEACLSSDMRRSLHRNARGATLTALVLGVTIGGSREARRTVMQVVRDMSRKYSD
ncbi:MAG TPA: hypothetical protein VFP95_04640 [Gammaproteobacteria bacterium]|nr:hypothetical protein [Gammaproteobacteria bacterium]